MARKRSFLLRRASSARAAVFSRISKNPTTNRILRIPTRHPPPPCCSMGGTPISRNAVRRRARRRQPSCERRLVRPPLPPVALVSTWRQKAPQRHLREIEPNHQAAQRQIQRGRRRTLAAASTSELLLGLMLLLKLLLLELLLLELLLLGLLLLLETDCRDRPRRTGAPTPQRTPGSSHRTAINSRGVFSSVFGVFSKRSQRTVFYVF